jgi:hypothetical protein
MPTTADILLTFDPQKLVVAYRRICDELRRHVIASNDTDRELIEIRYIEHVDNRLNLLARPVLPRSAMMRSPIRLP